MRGVPRAGSFCLLWQEAGSVLLPGSGRHTWAAGCASRRQLSPAHAYCGSAMSACGSETYGVSLALAV